jgi:hypothetical protein
MWQTHNFISAKNRLWVVKGGFFPNQEKITWFENKQNKTNMFNTTNLGDCLFYNGWIIISAFKVLKLTPMYQWGHILLVWKGMVF